MARCPNLDASLILSAWRLMVVDDAKLLMHALPYIGRHDTSTENNCENSRASDNDVTLTPACCHVSSPYHCLSCQFLTTWTRVYAEGLWFTKSKMV